MAKMELKKVNQYTQPSIEEKIQMELGERFKKLFSETASQPVPERFAALLDRLEMRETADQSLQRKSSVVK